MYTPMRLENKVAIVTGSGRGIGAETARRLANEGCHLVINDLDEKNARDVAGQIEKIGRRAMVSTHDVSDYSQAGTLVEECVKTLGRVDILVNNAGIVRDAMLNKMTESQWDDVIRVNLKGPFNMSQACAKIMMNQKSGRIVNFASVSWLGNIGQTNYSASKAGLVGMTCTLALELARYGITVNAIAPGFVDTALTQGIPPEIKEKLVGKVPLKRMGTVAEMAALVAFMVSPEGAYMTGQCIELDGGLSCGISLA